MFYAFPILVCGDSSNDFGSLRMTLIGVIHYIGFLKFFAGEKKRNPEQDSTGKEQSRTMCVSPARGQYTILNIMRKSINRFGNLKFTGLGELGLKRKIRTQNWNCLSWFKS